MQKIVMQKKQAESFTLAADQNRITLKDFLTVKFIFSVLVVFWLSVPPDTGFTWFMSSGFAAFISFISLLWLLFRTIGYEAARKKTCLVEIIKSSLLLAMSVSCLFFLKSIDKQAKKKLWEEAVKVQAQCQNMKKCPDQLAGMEKKEYNRYEYYTSTKTLYYFHYSPQDEQFYISIKYGPDTAYALHGGVNMPVSEEYISD
jgi:hypothetical protein